MLHAVGAVLLLVAFEKDDPLSVGAPLGTRAAGAVGRSGQLLLRRSGLSVSHEQLRRRIPIRIVPVIAHEREARAIRRPRRRRLVPLALSQTLKFFCRNIVEVYIAVAPREQITLSILLI